MAKKNVKRLGRKILSLLLTLTMVTSLLQISAFAAHGDRDDHEDPRPQQTEEDTWSYAYYLGQEYLGNARGAAVKPDPVGYGFQGEITEITFVDDNGTEWTFVWSAADNGEWRITGSAPESVAKAWPQITDGEEYSTVDGEYRFTLSADGSASGWTHANNGHANWFKYIRFIREYTVNVFYQNETGEVVYEEVTYTAETPLVRDFQFLYPNGKIIDDSEFEDGDYTDPITLLPADYLSDEMKAQGYEIHAATDAEGNDVLTNGVTISLLGDNVLNVYCTLKAPETDTYTVVHEYYTNDIIDNSVEGELEIEAGTIINAELIEGLKNPVNNELTYEFTSYDVDPATKTITLVYKRTYAPIADPVDSVIRYGVKKVWVDENAPADHVRPESITVELYADGKATGKSVVLSEENHWEYTWSDLPADKEYVAVEIVPENYKVESKQIPEGEYTVKGSLERITSCSETEIEVPAAEIPSVVVVSLTNKNEIKKVFGKYDFVVWTDYELSDAGKSALVELIAEESEALFEMIKADNVLFLYDGGANPYAEYVSFERNGETVVGTSLKTSAVWQQILYGAADAAPAYTQLTNTYEVIVPPVPVTGSLEISKVVEGEAAVPADATFTVTGPNSYSKTISYAEFNGGKYLLENLELGIYTVSESSASAQVDGYELTINGNNAEVEVKEEETASVTITNTYEEYQVPTGNLSINKTIVGLPEGTEIPETTRFDIINYHAKPADGNPVVKTVYWSEFENGSITIELPVGHYTVVEDLSTAKVDGYTVRRAAVYANEKYADVILNGTAVVGYTNIYEKVYIPQPALSVVKEADVQTAKVGDVITYTITVTNTGDATASGITIVDTPDRGLNIGEISNDGELADGQITWSVATLPAGISWSATVKAVVKNTGALSVVNTATAIDEDGNSDGDEAEVVLEATLKIKKNIVGLDAQSQGALEKVLSFTVTDPNGESTEYSYAEFKRGELKIEDPIPGVYTVVENNAEVAGYILDNGEGSWEIEVSEGGNAVVLNITNDYTGKVYNIWFDGGNHGNAGGVESGVYRNRWFKFGEADPDDFWSADDYRWSSGTIPPGNDVFNGVYNTNQQVLAGENGLVLYTLTWAQWLKFQSDEDMSFNKPVLEVDEGYTSDKNYYLNGGEVAFSSLEEAIAYMNANPEATIDANGFYNAYYVAKYEDAPGEPPYVPPYIPSSGGDPDPDPVVPPVIVIEEPEVPLADEPVVEIPDEEVPLANVPMTGDETALYAIMALASGLGLVYLALSGKKREDEMA